MVDAPVPGWNAHRFPQQPLRQPNYIFEDVPKCAKDLQGSVLQQVSDRDQLKECMGEMVLLCNEALRRSNASPDSSKPLSLEYIADRLDVDDPLFGYLVRTKSGMLQGFATITTFTNWQKTFRWDSLHDLAFYYDDDHDDSETNGINNAASSTNLHGNALSRIATARKNSRGGSQQEPSKSAEMCHRSSRKHAIDEDGSLAHSLQCSVHLGDPYNEGIVWPRVAELSLLGALGCGRVLVSLLIEHLEFSKPSPLANYDFLVLQATENSIPFYESLGFVRVGAVSEANTEPSRKAQSEKFADDASHHSATPSSSSSTVVADDMSSSGESAAEVAETVDDAARISPDTVAHSSAEISSSPATVYEVKKAGETPLDIARKTKSSVWDILFLNKDVYTDIVPKTRFMRGTLLYVPDTSQHKLPTRQNKKPARWFIAKENDTPRMIARKFDISCNALVVSNRARLPELQANSRLKEGTRMKISNLNEVDDNCVPYCHWSFPDDTVENGEPSYMMVFRLQRKKSGRHQRTVQSSLAVTVSPFSPPSQLLPRASKDPIHAVSKDTHPAAPIPPIAPPTSFDLFKEHQQGLDQTLLEKPPGRMEKILVQRWRVLPHRKQLRYEAIAREAAKNHAKELEEYEEDYSVWKKEMERQDDINIDFTLPDFTRGVKPILANTLFNKVVKLRPEATTSLKDSYTYWFVLTFIPDLRWCRLSPMYQDGRQHGPERKKSEGRPIWRLVNEKVGHEIDMSSELCIVVKSKALRKTSDADREEWDIVDDDNNALGSCRVGTSLPVVMRGNSTVCTAKKQVLQSATPFHSDGPNKSMNMLSTQSGNPSRKRPLRIPSSDEDSSQSTTDCLREKGIDGGRQRVIQDFLSNSPIERKVRKVDEAGGS